MFSSRCRLARLIGPFVAIAALAACGADEAALRTGGGRPARARAPVNVWVLTGAARPVSGPLDGVPLAAIPEVLPVAVDYAAPVRPLYGLGQAELVSELLLEGGVTRFLAICRHTPVPRMEPVRRIAMRARMRNCGSRTWYHTERRWFWLAIALDICAARARGAAGHWCHVTGW